MLSLLHFRFAPDKRRLMTPSTLTVAALATVCALFASGCAEMTPGQNAAVFGTTGALLAGGIARATGASTRDSLLIGAAAGAVVAATVYVIAKRQATERQRMVAEQRARAAHARRLARERREPAAAKKRPRYIAVDTVKDAKSAPGTKKSVMIFDTQTEEIVGNNVYDVQSTPAPGGTAKFDTYTAEYVGGGS